MTLLLAGDIGGTKTILRLVEAQDHEMKNLYQVTYSSKDYADLVPMVREFLAAAASEIGSVSAPEKACFGIAGPVVKNTAKLTNLPWLLETHRLEQNLGINKITLINDFAAVGYGVLGLEAADLHILQNRQPDKTAPIAVIGAGTGLGQGFLIPQAETYEVFGSEGGHTDFAPRNPLEFELLQYLLDKYKIPRLSVERVVSGQGIVAIYQFLRDRQNSEIASETAQIVRTWEQTGQEKTVDPAAAIAAAALEKRDILCQETMQIFVEAYGAEAGNLALKLLPYGGLYIAGGIAAKILPLILEENRFLQAFNQKGRVSPLLERVPVKIVLNSQVGLIGAAICASRL